MKYILLILILSSCGHLGRRPHPHDIVHFKKYKQNETKPESRKESMFGSMGARNNFIGTGPSGW